MPCIPAQPPPLRAGLHRREGTVVYAAAAGVVLAVFIARRMVDGSFLYPGCGFRWLTGRPCPGCGGTHALAALAAGDPIAALAGNPLVATVALAMLGLAALAAADWAVNRGRLLPPTLARLRRLRGARWLIGIAMLANWGYLLCVLE